MRAPERAACIWRSDAASLSADQRRVTASSMPSADTTSALRALVSMKAAARRA
jgi:hypothetical protein